MKPMPKTTDQILQHLNTPGKAILSLHRRADGDSLGSNLALYFVLKAKGHDVTITSIDPVPEFLMFLPSADIVKIQKPSAVRWHDYETFWALDMGAQDMMGEELSFPKELPIINIDHHKTNTNWGTINYVIPDAVSCASVLYELFQENTIEYSKETAFCMLVGLLTDTGFFKYINQGAPLRMAADLMDTHKLDYQSIIFNIMSQLNIEDVIFMGSALAHMRIDVEKKAAILPIPFISDVNYEMVADKTHLLTSYLQSINGTEFGMLIIEKSKGSFRIQLRSRNRDFDVSALAQKLNGGGHKNAAGASVEAATIDEAIAKVLALV